MCEVKRLRVSRVAVEMAPQFFGASYDARMPFIRHALCALTVTVALAFALGGCGAATQKPETTKRSKPEEMEGGRKTSPSRRTSDERPRPWPEEKSPFEADRMGIEEYRVKKADEQSRKAREAKDKRKKRQQDQEPDQE